MNVLKTVSYQFSLGMIKQKKFFSLMKRPPKLSISYGDYSLKQYNTVEYLGCYLDFNLNGQSIACTFLKMIDTKLNFSWR